MCTERCIANTQKAEVAQKEYDALYHPLYCKNCNGVGVFYSSFDPTPAGVALSSGSMDDKEYCFECIGKGICPRCGQHTYPVDDDMEPTVPCCTNCQFVIEQDYGRPDLPECFCWELEEVKYQEEMYP